MENSSNTPIILIYFFLVGSGIYSIILSLYKLTNPHRVIDPKSTIQTKLFKLSGPIGFIYGILVILIVIILVRTDNTKKLINKNLDLKNRIEILENENNYFKSLYGDSTLTELPYFMITVSTLSPISIFGGKVLIIYEYSAFASSKLIFKGIEGASITEKGEFQKFELNVKEGDRIFIKLISKTVYGINILDDVGGLKLEFYKIN